MSRPGRQAHPCRLLVSLPELPKPLARHMPNNHSCLKPAISACKSVTCETEKRSKEQPGLVSLDDGQPATPSSAHPRVCDLPAQASCKSVQSL